MEPGVPCSPESPDDPLASSTDESGVGTLLRCWLPPPRAPGFVARLDHYDLVRLIGVGGMGAVFLAQDSGDPPSTENTSSSACPPPERSKGAPPGTLTPVAIKVLRPEYQTDPRSLALFKREIRHLEKLKHPHILSPICTVSEPARTYLVMPYYPRGSLAHRIKQGPSIEPVLIRRIIKEIASALHYTHRRGLIHGDLKPANILLAEDDSVIVTDFGLARTVLNDSLHDPQHPGGAGTAAYLSPALAAGDAEDTRRDLYALGAILYELLTHQAPYVGPTREHIVGQILAGAPKPIRTLNLDAPEDLVRIAEKAMARNLRDRYASAQDILDDLSPSRGTNTADFCSAKSRLAPRSNRVTKVLAMVTLVALLTMIAWLRQDPAPTPNPRSPSAPSLNTLRLAASLPLQTLTAQDQIQMGYLRADSRPKLFTFRDGKHLSVLDENGELLRSVDFPDPRREALSLDHLQDTDGDGEDELFFSWREGSNRVVSVCNLNLYEMQRFQATGSPGTGTRGSVEYLYNRILAQKVVSLTPDGNHSLLAVMKTGYQKSPRGVWCFDYQSGAIRWTFETAALVASVQTADLDGDGKPEIIFTGDAVHNGNSLKDGTTDSICYIYVLNADGELVWRTPLGGERVYSTLVVGPQKGRTSPDLYVATRRGWLFGYKEFGGLFHLSNRGDVVRRVELPNHVGDPVIVDSSSGIRILLPDRKGMVHEYDADLNLVRMCSLREKVHDEAFIRLQLLGHTQKREREESTVLCLSWDNTPIRADNEGTDAAPPNRSERRGPTFTILGSRLNILTQYDLAPASRLDSGYRAFAFPPKADGLIRIAVFEQQLRLFDYLP